MFDDDTSLFSYVKASRVVDDHPKFISNGNQVQ